MLSSTYSHVVSFLWNCETFWLVKLRQIFLWRHEKIPVKLLIVSPEKETKNDFNHWVFAFLIFGVKVLVLIFLGIFYYLDLLDQETFA